MTATPISRATDPGTSHIAAEEVTRSGRRDSHVAMVMAVVRESPGLVAHEIAPRAGLDYIECVRRLSDAKNRGLARQGAVVKWKNRPCVTWWPEAKGGGRSPE